jgi:hypothetical protein
MFTIVADHVFPCLRTMADENTAHVTQIEGARWHQNAAAVT